MRSRNDGLGHFPRARLARSNRVLANTTERRKKAVGDEAREPAVNAVAVEEKSELGLRSAKLRSGLHIGLLRRHDYGSNAGYLLYCVFLCSIFI